MFLSHLLYVGVLKTFLTWLPHRRWLKHTRWTTIHNRCLSHQDQLDANWKVMTVNVLQNYHFIEVCFLLSDRKCKKWQLIGSFISFSAYQHYCLMFQKLTQVSHCILVVVLSSVIWATHGIGVKAFYFENTFMPKQNTHVCIYIVRPRQNRGWKIPHQDFTCTNLCSRAINIEKLVSYKPFQCAIIKNKSWKRCLFENFCKFNLPVFTTFINL